MTRPLTFKYEDWRQEGQFLPHNSIAFILASKHRKLAEKIATVLLATCDENPRTQLALTDKPR